MNDNSIHDIVTILQQAVRQWKEPIVTEMTRHSRNPFKVLIATILSLRTKDETTGPAAERLFKLADTPRAMLSIDQNLIAETIFPVGFYKNKARNIHEICTDLLERFDGRVPDDLDQLLSIKGVGRKTANLVLTHGYGKPGICVDTHVHRISNRFGYVKTSEPDKTEFALREKLPKEYWLIYNDLLVTFGQNLCKPISPLCSQCPVAHLCERVGVEKSR